ncbi:E3 SUMO-protein ligase pli1 [Friedmanniomyces endolithicus]|nr:E3 SUMO-protein ligase pli1 [Friedmanniomyces endolithicus]KAK0890166.1 E3 SUMO-protein ligase pli1 [Friedmanniomyces endolithicus]
MAASAGHLLQQSKARLQTTLKRIVNSELKDLCRHYGKAVSGNKADLQKRCLEILDDIVARGDPEAFEDFNYWVLNKGQARIRPAQNMPVNAYNPPTSGYHTYPMPPGRGPPMPTQSKQPNSGRYFKPSPFYEIVDTVVPLTDLPEMPQNRNTVRATITLSTEQAQRMASSDNMRLLMYCGAAQGMSPYSPVDIAFPNQMEVKVNEDEIKSNFKGLKNKPGSTKPADLTQKIRARANYPNHMTVTYALTSRRYAFVVHMVQYVSAAILTERIRTANIIPKDRVIAEMQRANADPDIEATSTRMSLKDPVSTIRITLPVRSTVCTHTQCFDGAMFMQLVEQAPQWNCPSIEKVDVEPDGKWKVIREEDEQQTNGTTNKLRASYDDDFDDDLVEVPDLSYKPTNTLQREWQPPPASLLPPIGAPSYAVHTPMPSSREQSFAQSVASSVRAGSKRPSGAVIDLTLSDDDDLPPRPAKRPQTGATWSQQGSQSFRCT